MPSLAASASSFGLFLVILKFRMCCTVTVVVCIDEPKRKLNPDYTGIKRQEISAIAFS